MSLATKMLITAFSFLCIAFIISELWRWYKGDPNIFTRFFNKKIPSIVVPPPPLEAKLKKKPDAWKHWTRSNNDDSNAR